MFLKKQQTRVNIDCLKCRGSLIELTEGDQQIIYGVIDMANKYFIPAAYKAMVTNKASPGVYCILYLYYVCIL